MNETETKVRLLDSSYKPFPTFSEWSEKTSVDTARWDRYNAEIQKRRESAPELMHRAREIAKRAAALDTGAIEGLYESDHGFTFTVALELASWELLLSSKGENVRSLFDAQMEAYNYVLDLATKSEPMSEAAIRILHQVVCRAQSTYRVITAVGPQEQELPKGRYKIQPNHVRTRDGQDHSYAPVDVTPAEMARLILELRRDEFSSAHPVVQAAYAHYALVVIHPFADGNGRVARALASVYTYRAISMPIMILTEHKSRYLDSLGEADKGQYQAFVNFMLARSLDTMQLVNETASNSFAPSAAESLAAIEGMYFTRGGYTYDEVDKAGVRLLGIAEGELKKSLTNATTGKVKANVNVVGGVSLPPPPSHRPTRQPRGLAITLLSEQPIQASVMRQLDLFVPKNAGGDDDVILRRSGGSADTFSARMEDLVPVASGLLSIRLSIFMDRVLGEMLIELRGAAEQQRRGQ